MMTDSKLRAAWREAKAKQRRNYRKTERECIHDLMNLWPGGRDQLIRLMDVVGISQRYVCLAVVENELWWQAAGKFMIAIPVPADQRKEIVAMLRRDHPHRTASASPHAVVCFASAV